MDYIFKVLVMGLGATILGAALLLFYVGTYIYREIKEEKQTKKSEINKCRFTRLTALDDWETSCGHNFYDASESGNPVTDWAKFCPYCGGQIDCHDLSPSEPPRRK